MKKINYILLFLIVSVFSNALTLPSNQSYRIEIKNNKFEKFVKETKLFKATYSSKINKQKRPKKPKGIQGTIPTVSNHVFKSFCNYRNYSAHVVQGKYTFQFEYSNGKRGPPSYQA